MDGLLISAISIGVVILFLIGVPIFLVIGFWVVGVSLIIDFTLANIGVTLYEGLNFFGLLALPLFILTGDLIAAAGIAKRLTDFAYAVMGWMRGGLAMASLAACGLFAAISGSNSATTATIGSLMHPEMKEGGYEPSFSAATVAAGGTVGIIIPPSVIFIVYGYMMNLSISDLFVSGLVPGIMMVMGMQITCYVLAKRNQWGHLIQFEPVRIMKTGARAYLGFFAIFIVLFGIYGGVFSPTEAAGVTVGFCLLSGLLVTRELKLSKLPNVIFRSGQITGLLAPLIAVSVVMQQLLSLLGANEFLTGLITQLGGYYPILAACMLIVFVVGMFLESLPVTIILAPILAPIAASIGMNPIHFAVVFLVGASIGFITPPYGLNLYVASGVTGIPYLKIVRYAVPYLVSLLLVWFVVALVPKLSTILLFYEGANVAQ